VGGVDDLTRLAVAARRGDEVALTEFVRRTQGDVHRLCRALGSADAADDLVQETYLRMVRGLAGFRGDAPARAWLLSIARRTCVDHVRSQVRRRRRDARAWERVVDVADPAAKVDLDDVIASLPLDFKEAFVLTQIVGLSYAEAAVVAGCPVGTIRSRIARARLQLVEALDSTEDGLRTRATGTDRRHGTT
jgi:RNA polymerase sigma-70 factor, ECF subfamily